MKIRNVREYDLEIGATCQVVEPGDTVDVDDVLGAALLEQPANWQAVKSPKSPKSAPAGDTQE